MTTSGLFPDSTRTPGTSTIPEPGEYLVTHPLLKALDALIARFFVMTPAQRVVIAVWIVHTWVVEHAAQTPYLAITSPEKRCGKTYLLELIARLVRNGWGPIIGPSEAVVFRQASKVPTMILDEYDTIFGPKTAQFHEVLRQMLNAGTRPGATVPRCEPPKMDVKNWPVFCPKALGGIGHLPETVQDRSVVIMMKRKAPNERVEPFRQARVDEAVEPILPDLVAWVQEYGAAVKGAEPAMPEELNDRMKDACEVLVAVADIMGDGAAVRGALTEVAADEPEAHETTRLKVLRDIRTLYTGWRKENMPTKYIVAGLHTLDQSWANYYDRGPLKDTDLAALLGYFGIKPRTVWIPEGVILDTDGSPLPGHDAKGYKYAEFADAWARYMPPEDASAGDLL
jgi:uncharacterized protein DUF3631